MFKKMGAVLWATLLIFLMVPAVVSAGNLNISDGSGNVAMQEGIVTIVDLSLSSDGILAVDGSLDYFPDTPHFSFQVVNHETGQSQPLNATAVSSNADEWAAMLDLTQLESGRYMLVVHAEYLPSKGESVSGEDVFGDTNDEQARANDEDGPINPADGAGIDWSG